MAKMATPQGYEFRGSVRKLATGGTEFQGHATLDFLESIGLMRPSYLEKAPLREISSDPGAYANKRLRDSTQRPFGAERSRNATGYRDYIIRTETGTHPEAGNCPSMQLFVSKLIVLDDWRIIIPYRTAIIAVDGETQCEARFMVRDAYPETGSTHFKITIYGNEPDEYAKVILRDANSYGVKMSEKIIRHVDPRGIVNRASREAALHARLDPDAHVSRFAQKPTKKSVVASDQIKAALIGAVVGTETPWELSFNQINDGAEEIAERYILAVASLIDASVKNQLLRKAPPLLWQAIAAAVVHNRNLESLSIQNAYDAEANAKTALRAQGRNLKKQERLQIFSSSL